MIDQQRWFCILKKNLNVSTNFLKEYKILICNKIMHIKNTHMCFMTHIHKIHMFNTDYDFFLLLLTWNTYRCVFIYRILLNWFKLFFNFLREYLKFSEISEETVIKFLNRITLLDKFKEFNILNKYKFNTLMQNPF